MNVRRHCRATVAFLGIVLVVGVMLGAVHGMMWCQMIGVVLFAALLYVAAWLMVG